MDWRSVVGAAFAALAVSSVLFGPAPSRAPLSDLPDLAGRAGLPVDFVANEGQWDSRTRFVARKRELAAAFEAERIRLYLGKAQPLTLTFEGASAATLVGERKRPGYYNYFVGDDPARWRSQVAAYESVLYRGLYDGVDVRVREGGRTLEYDLLVAPGGRVEDVAIGVDGARGLRVAPDGALVVATSAGTLRQARPVAWEISDAGKTRPVESRFRLLGSHRYGFEVAGRDPRNALVVDPGLEWATFLGGAGDETIEGIELASDGTGDIVVAGQTWSPDFAHTSGSHTPVGGTPYVARLNSSGSALVYSTFFGGSGNHAVLGVGLDSSNRPVVVGDTTSLDFPTTPGAYDRTPGDGFRGDYDAYVTKFDAGGSALVFSTYLGSSPGAGADAAWRVAHDSLGGVVVAGVTTGADFPTTLGAYDRTYNGGRDVFVSRLDPTGSELTYSTVVGGETTDEVYDMVVDPQGFVNLTGKTSWPSRPLVPFPTTADAFDRTHDGWYGDVFVTRLKLEGGGESDLRYSTLLGGNQYTEAGTGIAVDPNDSQSVTVSGWTRSADFPTTPGALLRAHPLPIDGAMGFVARFRFGAAGSLAWSTFYGAAGNQHANDVAVSDTSEALIVGSTAAGNPPTTERAWDRVPGTGDHRGDADAFAARISADGSRIEYSTLLGGSANDDTARAVAYAGGNTIVAGGLTDSPDFPVTPGAFDTVYGTDGSWSGRSAPGTLADDAFIAKVTLEPPVAGDATAPAAPTLRGPADGAAYVAPDWVTLDWTDVADESGIEAYHLQVSPNPSFAHDGGLAGTFYEAWTPSSVDVVSRSVSNTGTMYWRVRALDGAHNLGPWSAVRTFTVDSPTPPDAPILESPPSNSRLAPGPVTFGWKAAARAQYYELQIDTDSLFRNANRIWVRSLTTTRSTQTIAEGKYFWRVRASNQSFTDGPWSTVWAFEAKRGEPPPPVPPPGSSTTTSTATGAPNTLAPFTPRELGLIGGGSGTLTVTLTTPAPAGGAVVRLASNRPEVATVPPSVTVVERATSASATVTAATGLEVGGRLVVSGEYGGVTQGVSVNVWPDAQSSDLDAFTLAGTTVSFGTGTQGTATVTGGATVPGRVALPVGWKAGPRGAVVALAATDPDLVSVPRFVTIPAGANAADFTATTQPVAAPTQVVVFAARAMTMRITLELTPPGSLSTLTLAPTSVAGGSTAQGTVTLTSAAPAGGTAVSLASNDTNVATVPASVTVPAGSTSATFTVQTKPVGPNGSFAVISASAGGVTKTASLNVFEGGGTPSETVSVTRAEYDSGKRELRIEASSTSSSATLKAYVSSSGALIGTLSNLGGGKYGGQFTWSTNPQSVTVKSSLGGSATKTVTAK